MAAAVMAPIQTTCRARIGATLHGHPHASSAGHHSIGPNTEALVIAVLANRPHPEQGFRTCLGVLRLFRGIDPARAEAVAARALAIGALTYKSVASILQNNLDRAPQAAESNTVIEHQNLRGPGYFH
jgi:transposase